MRNVQQLQTMVVYTPSKQQQDKRRKWRKYEDNGRAHSVWDNRYQCW